MKVVILAGGYGTRISEESHLRPKPMIEIGDRPILWHIMKIYSHYGYNEFIICLGYRGYMIKEYFADYFLHSSDITFDFTDNNRMIVHQNTTEPWRVTLVDTGLDTMTGGRIKRVQEYIGDEPFMLTYGDGVADVHIPSLVQYHHDHGREATLTAIQPGGRFGVLELSDINEIRSFAEKRSEDGGWINGGFMVLSPSVFSRIEGDRTVLEREPLESLAQDGQLLAYRHSGFWQCMDTKRDMDLLESLWKQDKPPWAVWL